MVSPAVIYLSDVHACAQPPVACCIHPLVHWWCCYNFSCDVQPVAWLALGIVALVKVSVGQYCI